MTPYSPQTVSALSPLGYLVTGRSDRYALHRPLRDGRTVRIERSWTPVPVRREEKAMVEDHREAERARRVAVDQPLVPGAPVLDAKPAFWAFQVDQDGRIWVALHQGGLFRLESDQERASRMARPYGGPGAKLEWWEPLVVDVIEPTGRFLGTVRLPNPRSAIAWASGNTVWVLEPGEFDEEYLARYRVEHP